MALALSLNSMNPHLFDLETLSPCAAEDNLFQLGNHEELLKGHSEHVQAHSCSPLHGSL